MPSSEVLENITRTGFDSLIREIIAAIAVPTIDAGKAFEVLKTRFGFTYQGVDNLAHYGEGSERWEHPLLTQHNKKCGSRGILNQGFFTLYGSIHDFEEYRSKSTFHGMNGAETIEYVSPAHSTGFLEFCAGRVGNTASIGRQYNVIPDPPEVLDGRQTTLFQEVK